MTHPSVTVERRGAISLVRLDRAPVNAMDLDTLNALVAAVEGVAARGEGAMVLAGRPGSFSAGLDLKALPTYGPEQQRGMVTGVNRLCRAIYSAPMPTLAALSGHAIGGGMVMALACDARLGAEVPAIYSLPEVRAGVPFPAGALAVVRAELGPTLARRMVLCDLRLSPADALAAGVIDAIHPPDQLLDAALETAARLASLSGRALRTAKQQLRAATLATFDQPDPLVESWL
jgi:enoyl-CoA hydratase